MLPMCRVEVIFNTIVAASWQFFGYVRPFVAEFFVLVKNLFLFTFVDRCLIDVGVQVIVPSLAALLAGARPNFEFFFELISYKSPLLCAILFYEFYDGVILLLGPEFTRGLLLFSAADADLLRSGS